LPQATCCEQINSGWPVLIRPRLADFEVNGDTDHVGWNIVPDNYVQVTTSNCINEDGTLKTANSFCGTAEPSNIPLS
jgi:hypothetical protein